MPGFLYHSKDGLTNFEVRNRWFFDSNIRHVGLLLENFDLFVFYTEVGDTPERIKYTKIDLSSEDWKAETPRELLRPELEWEGGNLKEKPSLRAEIAEPANQLRDPDIFKDEDGNVYLLYSGGGEQAIGIAKLLIENK